MNLWHPEQLQLLLWTLLFSAVWGIRSRALRIKSPTNAARVKPIIDVAVRYPIMIEYRGNFPLFREKEFYDSLHYVSGGDNEVVEQIRASSSVIIPDKSIIEEKLYDATMAPPLCVRIIGPLNLICAAARRCSLLRSASIIWGDGETPEAAAEDSDRNYDDIIAPTFIIHHEPEKKDLNDWRVNFRRYGRSKGWTNQEKISLLGKFNPLLRSLKGDVNLKGAPHDLIYLEDWHDFHWEVTLKRDRIPKKDETLPSIGDENEGYSPHRAILGEIVEEPTKIESAFCLAQRPFLGTTTMSALPAHLAAMAACVGAGDRVLDPFCGTGSLLLSCAHLQADVVGSDIDATCLGIGVHSNCSLTVDGGGGADKKGVGAAKFKNQNFKRFGSRAGLNQSSMSTITNFQYYGLEHRLEALLACDIQTWVQSPDSALGALPCVGTLGTGRLFDAICCDPPYSKREKAGGAAASAGTDDGDRNDAFTTTSAIESEDQDNPGAASGVVGALFSLARRSVKPGGKLVFWYPSRAFVTEKDLRRELEMLPLPGPGYTGDERSLHWHRATPEKMHDKLWRWLVVYDVR